MYLPNDQRFGMDESYHQQGFLEYRFSGLMQE